MNEHQGFNRTLSRLGSRELRKRLLASLVFVLLVIGAVPAGFYAFEMYVRLTDPAARDFWWNYPRQPLPISPSPVVTIGADTVSSLYPNLDYQGPAPWETRGRGSESRIFHIRSNRFGFYTQHPLDEFPAKQPNEFRIVLIGGSGAQGHGASTNDRMMYRVLENKLQQSLSDTGLRVRVINLALAGHEARTNSGVLRAFGHELQPDLILAYNGANDIAQFTLNYRQHCDAYYQTLIQATYVAPDWVRAAGEYFPALLYQYGWASAIKRRFYSEQYRELAMAQCLRDLQVKARGARAMPAVYRNATVPMFISHFKAIKRDFCGIPIMLAWQSVSEAERTLYDRWFGEYDTQTNPLVVVDSVDWQKAQLRFYNVEKRNIRFAVRPFGAPKPTWEEVDRSGKAYNLSEGVVTVEHGGVVDDSNRADGQERKPPVVYYIVEPGLTADKKDVHVAYTEIELYRFREEKGVYQLFFRRSRAALGGYMNAHWYFVNVDRLVSRIDRSTPRMANAVITVHMDDVGQEVVAGIIGEHLAPVVRDLAKTGNRPGCTG
jgi:lysophospholipase L1-like esterase